jgi:molybdate/tungstate transport system substrate-binding protein
MLTGCGSSSRGAGAGGGSGTVHVLYAGSLVNLLEKQIGPAFSQATGDGYEGYGSDSQSVANAIKGKVQVGDVFICASPTVNATLEGASNGGWLSWYATFATSPLVIGYNPSSTYAARLRTHPWYQVLTAPGIKIGMTDPLLDPKGKLTVAALGAAAQDYHLPAGFAARVQSKATVFPEQDLLGRLEAGQLDVGFFYADEAVPAHIPTVSLGKVHEAAAYTVTVLNHAPDPAAGAAFVRYLLTSATPTLTAAGMQPITPRVQGDASAVPAALRGVLSG